MCAPRAARGWGRVGTFTFGTRLTRITRHLRERRSDAALARVSRAVSDWSGGTRIGDALHEFNVRWSRRVLGRGAVVLLVTDGWERGDPALLECEAARLQRAAYRVIWLDPLSGTRDYSPDARGARALSAHADDHLPANTLDGLARIAVLLGRVGRGRPGRRAEPTAARVARTPGPRRSGSRALERARSGERDSVGGLGGDGRRRRGDTGVLERPEPDPEENGGDPIEACHHDEWRDVVARGHQP